MIDSTNGCMLRWHWPAKASSGTRDTLFTGMGASAMVLAIISQVPGARVKPECARYPTTLSNEPIPELDEPALPLLDEELDDEASLPW